MWLPRRRSDGAHRVCGVCDVLWQPRCDDSRGGRTKSARFRKPVMTSFAQKKHSDFAPFVVEARQEVWSSAVYGSGSSIVALVHASLNSTGRGTRSDAVQTC